jgi:ABC-type phosphate transport system substrate-binding protein
MRLLPNGVHVRYACCAPGREPDEAHRRSFGKKKGVRGALAVGASLAAGALTLGAFAVPAGATLTGPANTTMVGSGSSTTFFMMQDMDTLFNQSPGCQEFVPFPSATTPQPLDYSCTDGTGPAGQQTTQSGVANAIPENPFNDVSVQEQPLGSSNGIQQLEDQGAHGAGATSGGVSINVANNENYARSSRALSSSDLKGLNFVAYAQDGVPWFHYTKTGGTATPSSGVASLTQAQMEDIWNGTDTNWSQVGGTSAPIVVFSAQEGSGTQSTFKTFLGFDPSAATNPVNCYTPSGGSKTCVGPAVIFENEDAQIQPSAFTTSQAGFTSSSNPDWGGVAATSADIKADAIFFFSAGKYGVQCKVSATDCGGSPLPSGDTNALGEVNGIAATEATILEGTFPVDRYLYNVYSNGSNSNIPAADAATVNYVSEIGFICNPNKGKGKQAVDMITGNSYIKEIQTIITENGFYPLSAGGATGKFNQNPIDEGHVGNPASNLLTDTGGTTGLYGYAKYKQYDTFKKESNGDPIGFCLVTTTDGNANS